ncbi:peptidase [Vibrio sp. S4M6]|uniref:helix-turn-helix domain-containing protein n=1 Tax=Vibrio sinus TaxID=2946865 RepID=UPI002029EB9C|nr:S24 family peptidase [Vibrio sinus]MCL9782101.1 peptidase [Vibrio sinus]
MREWFLSSELIGLKGMPNSLTGIGQKARRNNWLSRKASGNGRAMEYHVSNFHEDVVKELEAKYGKVSGANGSSIYAVNEVCESVHVPEFDVKAAAGAGILVSGEHQIGKFSVSAQLIKDLDLHPDHTAVIFCAGSSMLPTISDNDRILVDTRELTEPVKDGVYVIRIDDMVYVKRLKWNILQQGYEIVSDNPEFDSFSMFGEDLNRLKIIGRAAMVMRSL